MANNFTKVKIAKNGDDNHPKRFNDMRIILNQEHGRNNQNQGCNNIEIGYDNESFRNK